MIGRTSVYESTPGSAEIVMLGDSITDWGNWDEILPGLSLINRGIAGDTSAGVLVRIKEVVQRKPKLVVLMIGVNDILNGLSSETAAQNIAEIVRVLRKSRIHVILQSVVLMSHEAGFGTNSHIARLNILLRGIAADQSVEFLDLNPMLAPSGALHPDFTQDGLHLARGAYILWADRLRPLLRAPS
jgi:lysophospholipase L1-like esterase